jgi:tRNA(Ser,Leu) C12 N-acetylase TAN1
MYMPEKLAQAFTRQRKEAEKHIKRLEKMRAEIPEEQIYNIMSVDLRLEQLKSVLEWLDDSQKYFHTD